MKRIKLFLTVCLGLSVFQTVFADDVDTARAAKRGVVTTISTSNSGTRSIGTSVQKNEQNRSENVRSTTTKNVRSSPSVQSRTATKSQPTIKQRSSTQAQQKNVITRTQSVPRTNTIARTATIRKSTTNKTQKTNATRVAISPIKSDHVARAATLNDAKIDEIKSKNYSQCKTVYHECMDEFCANKDTTLRRCACSARIHEFDNLKKQLNNAEEKMLSFNQHLLTVGMDKEDILTINIATEGETAFAKTDSSESEKMLQKITDALNNTDDSYATEDLSAISLNIDMDSAWDSVDAFGGISTTTKSGLELYDAARPVCLEMAREICSDDELDIVTNSYKLSIQNDCDIVARAYNTQYNTAIEKIHETSALLDIARLNAYQQNNSDDRLTCKKKILDQLHSESVCGEDLHKCLDLTGQYINPSSGRAILSNDLSNLSNLLTEPKQNQKWTQIPQNHAFVEFLDSKKIYLQPATDQCKDMSDQIWSDFIEDALSKIKQAQTAKLDEIKRSCITMIADCKNDTYQSLQDLDSDTGSIFSFLADQTVNTVCTNVQQTCIATFGDTSEWTKALIKLTTEESQQKLIDQCLAVGKGCITDKCDGLGGNFELCIETKAPVRQMIVAPQTESRPLCWDKIETCFLDALKTTDLNFTLTIIPEDCNTYTDIVKKYACTLTKKYWGACKSDNTICGSSDTDVCNKDDILYWFYQQTSNNSCNTTE